jgi:tetratricopeptide (TPR) repeat protein
MVKLLSRIVNTGLVSTIALCGFTSRSAFSAIALPSPKVLISQITTNGSWKPRTQYLAQNPFKVKTPQESQRELAEHTEAIRRNPKSADVYLKRGDLRSDSLSDKSVIDYRGAIADYTEAIRLSPQNAKAYSRRAWTRAVLKDYQGAIADYTEVIRLEPQSAYAYRNRGSDREQLKDYQGAIADYTEAIRLDPKDIITYKLRGTLQEKLGDYQGALTDKTEFIRVIEGDLRNSTENMTRALINSSLSSNYFSRGNIRKNLGDYQGALADYAEAIRLLPNSVDLLSDVYVERSELLTIQENFQDALRDANQANQLSNNPNKIFNSNYQVLVVRGAARNGLGDYQGAQQDFDQALKLSKDYNEESKAKLFYWQGLLHLKQGNPQQAIDEYEKAINTHPAITKSKAYGNYSLIARGQVNSSISSKPKQPTPAPTTSQPTATAASNPSKSPALFPSTPNVYKIAKQITVLIDGQGTGSGSGVIISEVDGTYYVLTAKHVVESQGNYTIITPGGKKHELDYSQVKKIADLDLAVVQFKSEEDYLVAQMGDSEKVTEGDTIIVSGWPATDQAITKLSAPITPKGEIASIQQGNGDGYELIYSNATSQGMSGGPIFDSGGRLVGIHGRASGNEERGKNGLNLGIPIHLFLRQAPQAGLKAEK